MTEDLGENFIAVEKTSSCLSVGEARSSFFTCAMVAPPSPLPIAGNPGSLKLCSPMGLLLGTSSSYNAAIFLFNAFCFSLARFSASTFLPINVGDPRWSVFVFSVAANLLTALSQYDLAAAK